MNRQAIYKTFENVKLLLSAIFYKLNLVYLINDHNFFNISATMLEWIVNTDN